MSAPLSDNPLGAYLRERRAKLDPATRGLPAGRRRTPGLRREEVAQRAHVSTVWYTWLEQGRGGPPSAEVLERIARALEMTPAEREHLFLLAQGRPPGRLHYQPVEGVSPRVQRVLDALDPCPALVRSAVWDIVAWNRAAGVVMFDETPPRERNILRMAFCGERIRAAQLDWTMSARFIVASFRADAARAGATAEVAALVEELSRLSPEFAALWAEQDVLVHEGDGHKQMRLPDAGLLSFEYSAFAVDGRPDLSLIVYNPSTAEDERRIADLLARP